MKRIWYLAAILAWSATQHQVRAEPPWLLFDGCKWSFPRLAEQWQLRKHWCPDDYCPKALPCVPRNLCGCIDDYCPKTLPCVPSNLPGCTDDYWRKKCPLYLGALCEPWYHCGPGH
jgi:hypothetical protein